VGVDFRSRRLELGLTMRQLAEQCRAAGVPVSQSEISRIERLIHVPRPTLRKKLAEILGMEVAEIGTRPSRPSCVPLADGDRGVARVR